MLSRWFVDAIAGSAAVDGRPPEAEAPEPERLEVPDPPALPRSTFTPADPLDGTADGFAD